MIAPEQATNAISRAPLTKRRRLRQIVSTMARHGFGFFIVQLGLQQLIPFQRGWLGHPRRRQPYTRPEHLLLAIEELGTTFIKLGQVLSTRPDVVPADYVAVLSRLQDAAPPISYEVAAGVVAEELGAPPEQVFASFERVPAASASIGQVHHATLPDGTAVVVKVQRPGLEALVERDLEILDDVAQLASQRLPDEQGSDLPGLVEEFGQTLHQELDYTQEGRNADRFRELFADEPSLDIPAVYWDYTTPRVLTLERIEGIKISDVGALDAAGIDRRAVAERAVAIMLQEVFVHGFFHADPHPGNFFVLPGERIGLMDFGMVGRLDETTKAALLRIGLAVTRQDADRLVDALLAAGLAGSEVSREALRRDLRRLIGQYHGRPIKEIAAREFVHEVLAVARRHRIQLPSELAQLAKVIAMSEGLGAQLDPEFRLFEFAAPYFQRFWLQGRSPLALSRKIAADALDFVDLSVGLPRRLERMLTRLEHGGLQTTTRLVGLEPVMRQFARAANRLSASIITAALLIALSLLMQLYHPPFWERAAGALFFLGVLATAAIGLWVLWTTIRSR